MGKTPRQKTAVLVIGGLLVIGGGGALTMLRRQQETKTVNHRVFHAWYAQTPAPAVVVEQWTYEGDVVLETRARSEGVRKHKETTTISYHTHLIDDAAHRGTYTRKDWTVPVAGVWKDRAWVCSAQGEPVLLALDGMKPVADRAALRKAIGDKVGGDFEIAGRKCYVDEHSGRLAIKGADGKGHWVTTDLRHEPRTSDAVHPPGYHCGMQASSLIEPIVAECMASDAGPANLLVLSKPSAIVADADKPQLLSGVSANHKETRVLWTKPLTALTGQPDPFWLGAQPLAAGRVAVLIRTAAMRVHVIELDPADGTVKSTKVLFDSSAPGT